MGNAMENERLRELEAEWSKGFWRGLLGGKKGRERG
jgi:hypothetical protein